jgi:hypothetical protein
MAHSVKRPRVLRGRRQRKEGGKELNSEVGMRKAEKKEGEKMGR